MRTKILSLIGTIVIINFSYSNSSCIKQKFVNKNTEIQHDQQYWDEWLPVLKCDAKEVLKDRFEYCTDWLIKLIESQDFFYKTTPTSYISDYDINSVYDIIDIDKLKQEIELRKILLNNDMHHVDELNGNAWSAIPLLIKGCNPDHQKKIGQYLQWECGLLPHHWTMSLEKCYENVKLHFYSAYEYQDPNFYKTSLNSEKALSICLSGIEMDLITSNELTSNIELFANHLIFKMDKSASNEIKRYVKYLTREQNILLAKHIMSYYLSFPVVKQHNVAKYLLKHYVLQDLFKNMRPNQFLAHTKNVRPDNWCDVIIRKYLDNEFGTEYNKQYLESFKTIIMKNKGKLNEILLPEFTKYITVIFNKLVKKNKDMIQDDAIYKRLLALYVAFDGNKIIDNIMSYVRFNTGVRKNSKSKK